MPTSAAGATEPPRPRPAFDADSRVCAALQPGLPERGVSLIELLVALVIVAVLAGAVTLAFPDLTGRSLDAGAARVHGLIVLACERAERSGRDYGIAVGRDELRFGPFIGAVWQPLADSPGEALRTRTLPAPQSLELRVDGRALTVPDRAPDTPQLACSATGERTPFELDLRGDPVDHRQPVRYWRILARASGPIELERGDAN